MEKTIQELKNDVLQETITQLNDTVDLFREYGIKDKDATECLCKRVDCLLKIYQHFND